MKRIHHTKYEHNRSIFDIVQKFVSNSKLSKMLQICSNSTWWIHFVSWFHTTNMRNIRAFLTKSKISHFVSKMTWATCTQLGYPGRNQPSHCAILMTLGVWYQVDHRLMHSEFRGSGTIFNFRFSWGPPFGFITEIYG